MKSGRNRGGLRTAGRLTITVLAVAGLTLPGGPVGAAPVLAGYPSISAQLGWTQPNGDKNNTRHVISPINSRDVNRLRVAWTVPIAAPAPPERWPGTYAATPVVVNGVVYTQDLDSNVYAIELRTGRVLWTKLYNSTINGPNGVNVADGRVFGATTANAFALDARTGQELWSRKLTRNDNEGIDMAPGVNNGTVYVATGPGNADAFFAGNGAGKLWALDVATGNPKWTFDSVPTDLWGHPDLNSGGGMWYPPSFDLNGDLYVSIANPAPFPGADGFPWGSSRPGPNLYTNSVVKLNHRTGAVVWYNQVHPHDVYDWDLQNSPVLTMDGNKRTLIASGKVGYIYNFDPVNGHLRWKTPVGIHNGHDQDNIFAMNGEYDKLPQPEDFPLEVFPGVLGGVISPIAVDDTTIYAAVNNYGAIWLNQKELQFRSFDDASGEMVALDLTSGRIKWKLPLATSPYGGASVTNDLVFGTSFEGIIRAVNTRTGQVAWQAQLPAHSNSPVAINGEYVLAGAGWPMAPGEQAQIVAYRLEPTRR
jgi:alcohol dehydrogenase (cytochrome c)